MITKHFANKLALGPIPEIDCALPTAKVLEQLDAAFIASGHHVRQLAAEITARAALRTEDPAKQASR